MQVWCSHSWQQDRLGKSEAIYACLSCRICCRLSELQVAKAKVGEAEVAAQRTARDLEELQVKIQWLQRINTQVGGMVWRVIEKHSAWAGQ